MTRRKNSEFWVTWTLVYIAIQTINGDKPRDLEKTMTDSSCGYEINNETHTPHKILQAKKGFFFFQCKFGRDPVKQNQK